MQKEMSIFFICGNAEVFAIPGNTEPRQLTCLTRVVLIERPFDSPVVRKRNFAPAFVVVIVFCVSDVITKWLIRTHSLDAITDKFITGGLHPVFDLVVAE